MTLCTALWPGGVTASATSLDRAAPHDGGTPRVRQKQQDCLFRGLGTKPRALHMPPGHTSSPARPLEGFGASVTKPRLVAFCWSDKSQPAQVTVGSRDGRRQVSVPAQSLGRSPQPTRGSAQRR